MNHLKLKKEYLDIIIPTRNRHGHLLVLLKSLKTQKNFFNKIIVVNSGRKLPKNILELKTDINLTIINSPVKGQIVQRKYGTRFLSKNFQAVAFLDDDLNFDKNAFQKIISFWNKQKIVPAGVSFNIMNLSKQKNSVFRKFFGMEIYPYGRVFMSGYNTPITGIQKSIRSEWLLGGATIWRKDIIENYIHEEFPLSKAICEDLIFSYPISKKEYLFVCSEAKTNHIDENIILSTLQERILAKYSVLMRFHFVIQNSNLSKALFFWMIFGQILGKFVLFLIFSETRFSNFVGTLIGFLICIKLLILNKSVINEIREIETQS